VVDEEEEEEEEEGVQDSLVEIRWKAEDGQYGLSRLERYQEWNWSHFYQLISLKYSPKYSRRRHFNSLIYKPFMFIFS
jgi:hypothetical protein